MTQHTVVLTDLQKMERVFKSIGAGFARTVPDRDVVGLRDDDIPAEAVTSLRTGLVEFFFDSSGRYLGLYWFCGDESMIFDPRDSAPRT